MGSRRDRVFAKFIEIKYEKCDRLFQILAKFRKGRKLTSNSNVGLFHLQQTAIVMGKLWCSQDLGIKTRLLSLLHTHGMSLRDVRAIIITCHNEIGDKHKKDCVNVERCSIVEMLKSMG